LAIDASGDFGQTAFGAAKVEFGDTEGDTKVGHSSIPVPLQLHWQWAYTQLPTRGKAQLW
jgi:hypothetical protein